MVPPAPTTSPKAFVSSCISAPPVALETAGNGAFEADGRAEEVGFFLGAMVDGVVEDEDGDEVDALHMPSGSCKRAPYLVRQRCRGKPRPPMGPGGPLLVRQGDDVLQKEQTSVGQHVRDHAGNLPRFGLP